jgi:branched-chain amino acid transport system substrate-binding protein
MKSKAGIALLLIAGLAACATAIAAAATDGAGRKDATAALATATSKCGKTMYIGVAAPITGPASSIGGLQLTWAQYAVAKWNKNKKKTPKFKIVQGDTQLPNVAEAIKVAKTFASDSRIMAVAGPAGSQEVVDSFASYQAGGLAFVSGSATRTSLTDGSRKGYFFRVVPNDDVQGPTVGKYIANVLKPAHVYIIDDQETYSQGLADTVQAYLKAKGIKVDRDSVSQQASDFSSLIAKIPSDVKVVYIPWQLAPKGQLLGQQLKAAGKNVTLFGSDGMFDESSFTIGGSFVSFFPVNTKSADVTAYKKTHGGKGDYFGAPTDAAATVAMQAISKACKAGKISRAIVRANVAKTVVAKADSILGFRISFTPVGDLNGGGFGIWEIANSGAYNAVG